jgi:Domain of unknown function (DUF5069)
VSDPSALPSPADKVGPLVYFARMIAKIRAHARGKLSRDYQPNLGKGFDEFCVNFLQVNYDALVERVKQGGSDEDILEWCLRTGRRPSNNDVFVWNEFMRKRGWNDDVTETLERRKKESGMRGRADIQTMFDFIDADEGRAVSHSET